MEKWYYLLFFRLHELSTYSVELSIMSITFHVRFLQIMVKLDRLFARNHYVPNVNFLFNCLPNIKCHYSKY